MKTEEELLREIAEIDRRELNKNLEDVFEDIKAFETALGDRLKLRRIWALKRLSFDIEMLCSFLEN